MFFVGGFAAAGVLLSALALHLVVGSSLPAYHPVWYAFWAVIAAGVGLGLEARFSRRQRPRPPEQRDRLEAELLQLNDALSSQSLEHTSELARLNIELQLQMAMYRQAEETARTNEERFRNMADHIQEGLTIIENGHLVYLNDRACEIFGDCPEGNLQDRIRKFAVPEDRGRLMKKLIADLQSLGGIEELEYWIVRPDGSRRCIHERYSHSSADGLTRTFVVTSDITASVQAMQILETAVADRTRELSTVLDVSLRIASTLELEPLLHLVLDQIQTILPYSGAAIFTLTDGQLEAAVYEVPGLPEQNRRLWLTLENGGPYLPVVSEKKVLIIDDIQGDTPLLRALHESLPGEQRYLFEHARAWIGIPLIVRDQVTGLLSLTHATPGFYDQRHARLATAIANQVAIAVENARLYEKAQDLAVLEERHRIARELHDSVTQLLYGICLYCTAGARSIRSGGDHIEANLAEIKENALQALREMRLLILELDPPMLQKAGLEATLRSSLEVIETRTGLETSLNAYGIDRLPRTVENELYRIAIEALNNLVRYSRAGKVEVSLRSGDGWVWMEICDNGVGFDPAAVKGGGGMGLHTMEQRTQRLNGRFEIISKPGGGTRIRVEAPLFGAHAQSALAN